MNWYIVCLSVSFQYKGMCFDSGGFIGSGVLNTTPLPSALKPYLDKLSTSTGAGRSETDILR